MTDLIIMLALVAAVFAIFMLCQARRIKDLEDQQTDFLTTIQVLEHHIRMHAVDLNHKNLTIYGQYGTLKEAL